MTSVLAQTSTDEKAPADAATPADAVAPTHQVARREKQLERILDSASDAFIGMDADGLITEWNRAATRLFGWERDDVVGRSVAETIVPLDLREAHTSGVTRFLTTRQPRVIGHTVETRGLRNDGTEVAIELTRWVLDESGVIPAFYAFIKDITDRRLAEERARHDALTGLANRAGLMAELEESAAEVDGDYALLFIDLDRFKRVNDDFGHDVGDALLRTVAERLVACARPSDAVARFGGDEFAILLRQTDAGTTIATAQRVIEAVAQPLGPFPRRVPMSASVGIAPVAAHRRQDPIELLREADAAMYAAKQSGRAHYVVYDDRLRSRSESRKTRERELEAALDHRQFEVYYQPIVWAPDRRAIGAEALLRWHRPRHGITSMADQAIVRAVVELGAEIGFSVLAEGVETPQQLATLTALGCDYIQGFLLGRPEPVGACEHAHLTGP